MYGADIRTEARLRVARGQSLRQVAADLNLGVRTVHRWSQLAPDADPQINPRLRAGRCWRCGDADCPAPDPYGYLLGQYLGDGHLVVSGRVPRLRISCSNTYPGIREEVRAALAEVSGNAVGTLRSVGCSDQNTYWNHWPCLLPQHGPGRKHERPIVLAVWQREIVQADPWPLIRGLIHSDGCRAINRVVVRGKAYRYPRYFFANESSDILAIMGDALDLAGVAWRFNRPNSISVARRAAVAVMDERVGPKR